jgi:hypothetical protein
MADGNVDALQNTVFVEEREVVHEDARLPGSLISNTVTRSLTMADAPWHTENVMQKPILVKSIPWDTTKTSGTILTTFELPKIINETPNIQNTMLKIFTLFRLDFTLRFQFNSTPFHQGRVIVFYDPFGQMVTTKTPDRRKWVNIYAATGNPHIQLDAGESNAAEITIPFVHMKSYLTTNSTSQDDLMGKIHVVVLNPLRAATGSTTTIQIATFLRATRPSLHVPIYEHTPLIPTLRSDNFLVPEYPHFSSEMASLASQLEKAKASLAEKVPPPPPIIFEYGRSSASDPGFVHIGDHDYSFHEYKRKDGKSFMYGVKTTHTMTRDDLKAIHDFFKDGHDSHGPQVLTQEEVNALFERVEEGPLKDPAHAHLKAETLDVALPSLGSAIGHLGGSIYNFITGNYGRVFGSLRSAVSAGENAFKNFDKPTHPLNTVSKGIVPIGPLSHHFGVDPSIRLGVDPMAAHALPPEVLGTVEDEMDIKKIACTKMLGAIRTWTTSNAASSLLADLAVGPFMSNVESLTVGTTTKYRKYNTFLSYISSMFCFWRGSIQVRIDFVATKFHTGRLLACFVPNSPATPPSFDVASSAPYIVLDLHEAHSFEFTIPYVSSTPWKQFHDGIETNPYLGPTLDEHVLGHLYIFIQNPLAVGMNVANSIDYNIYVGAGPDIQFAVPRNPITDASPSVFYDSFWGSNLKDTDPDILIPEKPKPNPVPLLAPAAHEHIEPTRVELKGEAVEEPTNVITRTNDFNSSRSVNVLSRLEDAVDPDDRFGEKYVSLLDWSRRFTLERRLNFDLNLAEPTKESYMPVRPYQGDAINEDHQITALYYVGRLFALWYGSIRYKFLVNAARDERLFSRITHYPTRQDSTIAQIAGSLFMLARSFWATALSSPQQNTCMEVEAPFYNYHNFLPVELNSDNPYSNKVLQNGVIGYTLFAQTTSATNYSVYMATAAGDDFRYSFLVAPPVTYGMSVLY